MAKTYNPFLDILPNIDVHGYTRDMIKYTLDSFLNDNIKLNNKKIVIVHGKGEGILRKVVHDYLKKHPNVKSYRLGQYGEGDFGVTIAELK